MSLKRKHGYKKDDVREIETELVLKDHKIAVASLIVSIIAIIVAVTIGIVNYIQGERAASEATLNSIYTVVDQYFGIDPTKAALSYTTGMDLYSRHEYSLAMEQFRQAVTDQEKITGADSIEVGKVYSMLGLSETYSLTNRDNAISDFTKALNIYESHDEKMLASHCYYCIAEWYFESGTDHLNLAQENVQSSITVAQEIISEEILWAEQTVDQITLRFPAQQYDADTLYKSSRYCEIMQDNYDLLGKINQMIGNSNTAFYYFNIALDLNSQWVSIYPRLLVLVDTDSKDKSEIADYIGYLNSLDMLNNLCTVRIYHNDSGYYEDLLPRQYKTLSVFSSSNIATYLTNRAMSECCLQCTDEAILDCEKALTMWNGLPYSERTNISDTYIYLAIAKTGDSDGSIDFDTFSVEKQKDIINDLNCAVEYAEELYGKDSPKTAYTYEKLGETYALFQQADEAIYYFDKALQLYLESGNTNVADYIQERIDYL